MIFFSARNEKKKPTYALPYFICTTKVRDGVKAPLNESLPREITRLGDASFWRDGKRMALRISVERRLWLWKLLNCILHTREKLPHSTMGTSRRFRERNSLRNSGSAERTARPKHSGSSTISLQSESIKISCVAPSTQSELGRGSERPPNDDPLSTRSC